MNTDKQVTIDLGGNMIVGDNTVSDQYQMIASFRNDLLLEKFVMWYKEYTTNSPRRSAFLNIRENDEEISENSIDT